MQCIGGGSGVALLGKESREPPAAGERPGGRVAGGAASPGIPGASELPSCSNHLQCPVFSLCSSSGMKSLFLFYMNVQRGAHKWDKCVWDYLGKGGVAINIKFYSSSVFSVNLVFFCRP